MSDMVERCCGCGGKKKFNSAVCTECFQRIKGAEHFRNFTGSAGEWLDWVQSEAKASYEALK